VLLCAALGAAAAFGLTAFMPKVYVATTTQFVRGVPNTGVPDYQSAQLAVNRAKSYSVLIGNPDVLAGVISDLGLAMTPGDVYSRLTVENPIDTALINVTARGRTADEAQALSIAAADNLAKLIMRLESAGMPGGKSPIDIQTAVPALRPLTPASPRLSLNLAVGVMLGLSLGSIVALGLDARPAKPRRGGGRAERCSARVQERVDLPEHDLADKPALVAGAPAAYSPVGERSAATTG
jgi:capsular polysaccharide biosynthesis protein